MGYYVGMDNVPELMVTTQVAEILGVSRKTIWAWAKDGIMVPAARTSSKRPYLLFDVAEVDRMASVLAAAGEAQAERDRAEAEQREQRRLDRLEKLKTTNPAGLSKAERLTAIEDARARKAAERAVRLKHSRRPRRDRSRNGKAPHDN